MGDSVWYTAEINVATCYHLQSCFPGCGQIYWASAWFVCCCFSFYVCVLFPEQQNTDGARLVLATDYGFIVKQVCGNLQRYKDIQIFMYIMLH